MAKALEYILLPIDERINYRHERNLGILEWYHSVADVERHYGQISRNGASELLHLNRETIDALIDSGTLQISSERNNGYRAVWLYGESVHRLQLLLQKTAPAIALAKYFNINSDKLYKKYSPLIINLTNKKGSKLMRLNFKDFSSIFFSLYKRDYEDRKTRTFYTARDLAQSTALQLGQVLKQLRKGYINAIKVSGVSLKNRYIYRISPPAFFKAIDDYKRLGRFAGKESYYSTQELAQAAEQKQHFILYLLRKRKLAANKIKGIYLFTENEFLRALDFLSTLDTKVFQEIDRINYRTIQDLARETPYHQNTIMHFVRNGFIQSTKVKQLKRHRYFLTPEQFTEAKTILNTRARKTHHIKEELKIRKRILLHAKIKNARMDNTNYPFPCNTIDELALKDELQLWMQTIRGNDEAFNELLRLYEPIIKKYAAIEKDLIDYEERIVEGDFGLWKAVSTAYSFQYARRRTVKYIHYSILKAQILERRKRGIKMENLENLI